jgi:hypothetical protein
MGAPRKGKQVPDKWVRLSDGFYQNRKVLALIHTKQHRAVSVYVCGLSWCGRNLSDGFIPEFALSSIHGTPADAKALCAVDLWVATGHGWHVHGWEEWQDSNDARKDRSEHMAKLSNMRWHGHPDGPANVVRLPPAKDA